MDYRDFKQMEMKAAANEGLLCMMSAIRQQDLEMLDLSSACIARIREKQMEDDWAGMAAVFFVMHIANADLTPMDKMVVAQILQVASACLLGSKVVTKDSLDKADVLIGPSMLDLLKTNIEKGTGPHRLSDPAFDEEMRDAIKYIEQYNKDVVNWSPLGEKKHLMGESEKESGATSEASVLSQAGALGSPFGLLQYFFGRKK
jgi:hypothetical protein